MKLIILGASAGGGFPQWNCNCRNCAGLRDGSVLLGTVVLGTLGLGLALATANAFFRDVEQLLGPALLAWFYLTCGAPSRSTKT